MTLLTTSLRFLSLTLLVGSLTAATSFAAIGDQASHVLELRGSVPVKAAGPYVEIGTYSIQVTAKLGRPAERLADGSWLYPNFAVNESDANGTLLVRFTNGRVSELSLLSHAKLVAMHSDQKKPSDRILVAVQDRR